MVTRIFNGEFFEDLEVDRDAMRLSQCTAELKGLGQAPAAPQWDRRFFSSKHNGVHQHILGSIKQFAISPAWDVFSNLMINEWWYYLSHPSLIMLNTASHWAPGMNRSNIFFWQKHIDDGPFQKSIIWWSHSGEANREPINSRSCGVEWKDVCKGSQGLGWCECTSR